MALNNHPLTTNGLFLSSQNFFRVATDESSQGDVSDGIANMALGLQKLNEALVASLTQMSQDIAALKAEVESLKARPMTGLQNIGLQARR